MSEEQNKQIVWFLKRHSLTVNPSNIMQLSLLLGSAGGGTPAGGTNEIQYNDNGEFASDELFYRAANEFYVTSVMESGDEMDIGQGDWENVIGVPITGSGLTYFEGNSGLFSGLFVGNLSELGGGVGLLSFTQDDVTGNTAALSLSPDVIYFNLDRENQSASIVLDEFASSMDFGNAEYKAYLSLENASAGLFLKDENSGEERSIAVVDSGVRINSAAGIYTLPDGDGTAGQIITTNGAGNLIWKNEHSQRIELTIASADVLTLFSNPLEIVPAPGAGFAIDVTSASATVFYTGTAYATSTSIEIVTAGATVEQRVGTGLLAATVVTTKKLVGVAANGATDTQIIENAAVNVSVSGANPTGGTAVVKVYVNYHIIEV